LDGLDNNDGILLVATTNHLDRLDNSVANRPSRFDRKYLFDDPDEEERRLYCKYWQKKLENNKKVSFPDTLVDEVAKKSRGLSFAYIKEALYVRSSTCIEYMAYSCSVSTLVLIVGDEELDFAETLKAQVKELKDQMKQHPPEPVNVESRIEKEVSPSELGYAREVLQRLAGPDVHRGLTAQTVIPSSNLGFRRWI
jgi:transitional endoplasmic reticulum ATPase